MARKLFMKLLLFVVCAVTLAAGAMTTNAAPLPNGIILKITAGVGSGTGFNAACIVGSCIGWYLAPGIYSWRDISPGTDGGFIVGKSQASGGQEIDSSLITPGQLTTASDLFFNGWIPATLYTLPGGGTANIFDDTSCTKAACIDKTVLNTLNAAWNGISAPMGSAVGCNVTLLPSCTADQQAGIFVNNYGIDLVGNTWFMDYAQVLPSVFTNVPFRIIFRGKVVRPNCPVVNYAWVNPSARSMVVFGSNLRGATSVTIDGVDTPVFQPFLDDMLWVLPPNAVTWPWKPGTVQVTNANAGCSGYYPVN